MSNTMNIEENVQKALSRAEMLDKSVLMPDIRRLSDLFINPTDNTSRQIAVFRGEPYVMNNRQRRDTMVITNHVWAFHSRVNKAFRFERMTEALDKALRDSLLVVDNDSIYFDVIEWEDFGLALVCAKHNQILGGRWLGFVDANDLDAVKEANSG